MAVVCSLHLTQHGCQNIEIILQLVSDAPEAERRMVAIFLTYTLCLGTQELDRSRIFSKRHTPYWKLYLHIESHFIGYIERSFRRTPGVKTEMIHSIFACRSIKFSHEASSVGGVPVKGKCSTPMYHEGISVFVQH